MMTPPATPATTTPARVHLLAVVRSEVLRHRRTFTRWLIVLGPLTLVLATALPRALNPAPSTWAFLRYSVGNWWPVLWLAFGTALLAAHAAAIEQRAG
ncbi:MAG: hypothetical protein IVW57_18425, partial [Ktedonobacterales bacterium]|nr:hypothetical protein [Ktedonobacterales bacterium]